MLGAPPTPAHPNRERALGIVLIACLTLAAWGIAYPRRPTSGIKKAPVHAPLKPPQRRERPTLSLDPESVCQARATVSVTRTDLRLEAV